jgi:hypothetical protein
VAAGKTSGFLGVGGLGAGIILVAVHSLGHAAESFRELSPVLGRSVAEIAAKLEPYSHKTDNDEILLSALCNSVAGVTNGKSPDDNVGGTLVSAVEEKAGVPFDLPQDKFDEFSAAMELAQWNGAAAAKYLQACVKAGFPT